MDEKARQVVGKLLALFELADTLGVDCQNAPGINNGDYEDAILMENAKRIGADCIVTRNEYISNTLPSRSALPPHLWNR